MEPQSAAASTAPPPPVGGSRAAADLDPADFLKDPRFHQSFTLPDGLPSQPRPFKVTYSDYGHRDPVNPDRERVLLLCGPLLASRYLHIAKDAVAKKHGVRIIAVDRPGFGGTTGVPGPSDRVRAWLEIVPALLDHLGIHRRLSALVAHSGGTVYALNTLLYLRHLFSGPRPYVALCAPWISSSHTGVSLTTLASRLPDTVLDQFYKVAGFFNRNIAWVTGFSSATSGAIGDRLLPSSLSSKGPAVAPGVDAELASFEVRLWTPLIERVFSEDVQGMGQEVVLLLKGAGQADYWGAWEDYDRYVALLAEGERTLISGAGQGMDDERARLRVEVFFSEADHMIGVGDGPKWFDHCWRAEQRGDMIDYSSCVVPGTDHDNILGLKFDVFGHIFRRMTGVDDPVVQTTSSPHSAEQTAL